jgi:hypothetical protein
VKITAVYVRIKYFQKKIAPFFQAVFGVNSDKDVDFILKHLTGLPADPQKTIVHLQENQGALSMYQKLAILSG